MVLDVINRGHTDAKGKNTRKPMKWILIDSAVIGGIAFFACLPAVVPTINEVYVALKAFGGAFIVQLAIERGLKRK